jgi:ADP-ribose pyrophosphatase
MEKSTSKKYVYKGKIIAVTTEEVTLADGKIVVFEKALRAPGVRIIVQKENKFLLTREFRRELNKYDFRLAGGKVVDSLEDYINLLESGKPIESEARDAVVREAREELGISLKNEDLELYYISKAGATIDWDLFYYVVTDFSEEKNQSLGAGEDITTVWLDSEEVKQMCLDGRINEDRTVGILLKYILKEEV